MVSERVIPVSLAPRHELVRAWLTGVRFEALPSVPEWDGDASGSSEIDARIVVRPTPGPERSLRVRAWLWTTDGRAWLVARSADSRRPVPDLAAFVRSVARRPLSQARRHRQDWRVTVRLAGPLAGRRVTDQAGPGDEAAAMTAWRRWRERLTITL
jgi:hypothetical protein